MPHSWKGGIAGFAGALVLAALFLMFQASGFFVQFDFVTLIDRLGSIGRTASWVDHFIVGALLWGPLFAGFDATTAPRPRWQKGIAFSLLAWLAMMLIFMPVVGVGFFGLKLSFSMPVGMLVLHLIFGLVLGSVFEFLDKQLASKDLVNGDDRIRASS